MSSMSSADSKSRIDQMRRELTDVSFTAVSEFLRTTRGASLFGAKGEVKRIDGKTLQVKDDRGNYFNLIVKQSL